MNRIQLSDNQVQFLIDSQEAKIESLKDEIETISDAKVILMDYITSLGKEHVLACAKLMHEQAPNPKAFVDQTGYWHDSYVDLSPLNALSQNGEEYFKPWNNEEKEAIE